MFMYSKVHRGDSTEVSGFTGDQRPGSSGTVAMQPVIPQVLIRTCTFSLNPLCCMTLVYTSPVDYFRPITDIGVKDPMYLSL